MRNTTYNETHTNIPIHDSENPGANDCSHFTKQVY